jgi:hypothetical protein
MMTFIKTKKIAEAVKVMKWLMMKRRSTGGFDSTIDTTVAMQALTMMAAILHTNSTNIDVKLVDDKNNQRNYQIRNENALTLYQMKLPQKSRKLRCVVNGTGFAFLQVAYRYKTIVRDPIRQFDLSAVDISNDPKLLDIKICAKFLPEGNKTNTCMTLLEVYFPSGYVYDQKTFELVENSSIRVSFVLIEDEKLLILLFSQKLETLNQNTVAVMYFDSFPSSEVCVRVKGIRQRTVLDLKKSVVKIYEYSDDSESLQPSFENH